MKVIIPASEIAAVTVIRAGARRFCTKRATRLPKGFQLEPVDPYSVGLGVEASDAFSPEELVELFAHPRKIVDWDRLEEINYFWKGE